ncbi:uncharacterized protein LOC120843961 [Ixodes scapularis]|uniref:uncharacterized protein LOC120843961 n=1 Tax=Ixodes scapularis TaxID=6945 RepID=UPI001A9E7C99|nr:uncharacterized protein LOC120843961 [Ixodes scapularis]
MSLSLCLTGEALTVVGRMTPEESLDYSKERDCKTLESLAVTADHFLEAQGQTSLFSSKEDDLSHKSGGRNKEGSRLKVPTKGVSRCFLCNKSGHKAAECWTSSRAQHGSACWRCGKPGHKSDACNWKPEDKGSKTPQASCMLTVADSENPEETYIVLRNGEQIPIVNAALGKAPRFLVDNMPVVRGEVCGRPVTVLRDSGCNTVVVKRDLVPDDKLTGVSSPVFLLDRTVKYLPEAEIEVRTPFFTGSLIAKCMDNPLYDLVLGNVHGVRGIDDLDEEWNDEGRLSGSQLNEERQTPKGTSGKSETGEGLVLDESGKEGCDVLVPEINSAGALKRVAGKENNSQLPVMTLEPTGIDHNKLKLSQRNDESLKKCFAAVGKKYISGKSHESEFVLRNEILYRRYKTPAHKQWEQLIVPRDFQTIVLKLAHEGIMSGHQGTKKTTDRIQEEFYWPGIAMDIKRFVKSCDMCQRTIHRHMVPRAPLGTMPIIDTPFQRVGIDIVGPIAPSSETGNRYILTMVDFATRYPDAVALKSIDTVEVAEGLLQMFSRVGLPREIVSDRGSCFTSALMKEISRILSLRLLTTTPYHPMCNGLVERFNGTLKQMIKRMCQEKPRCWDRYLTPLLFAYREVPQSSLGFSPFDLLYGRYVRGPMAVLRELWTNENIDPETKTTYEYMVDLRKRLEETCKAAHEELKKAQLTQKEHYDKKSRARQLREGDRVLILLPTDRNKLVLQWKGPFRVVEKRNDVDYVIDLGQKTTVFHINMLKRYEEREVLGAPRQVLAGMAVEEDPEEQEVPHVGLHKLQDHKDVQFSEEMTEFQTNDARKLLEEFQDVFSDLPGQTRLIKCRLKLKTDTPIQVRQYPIPFALQEEVEKEIGDMLRQGIIEKCDSAYNSPGVVISTHMSCLSITSDCPQIYQSSSNNGAMCRGQDNVGSNYRPATIMQSERFPLDGHL